MTSVATKAMIKPKSKRAKARRIKRVKKDLRSGIKRSMARSRARRK